jgi:hypothetical protein
MLNAVQQFSGAIGVTTLGTVFLARVENGGLRQHGGELVIGLAAVLYVITFALVWLLPKHAREPGSHHGADGRSGWARRLSAKVLSYSRASYSASRVSNSASGSACTRYSK